jgi:hypothetical protein
MRSNGISRISLLGAAFNVIELRIRARSAGVVKIALSLSEMQERR